MNNIQMINIDLLAHHPDNPRKDLGDLTELTESIKAKGVLQNLTVVPCEAGYFVLIGNRRFEAAKKAGLQELPCVIADNLGKREQVEIMLMENMQRADLTIYEQAEGFQMMIDLGSTADEVAEKTGFGRSTVDKRIKLLNLNKEEFKAAAERDVTLEDFIKIASIEDEELRNDVLQSAGTKNFDYKFNNAERIIKQRKWNKNAIKKVKKFAKELSVEEYADNKDNWDYVDSFYYWSDDEENIEEPEHEGDLYYLAGDAHITVYEWNDNPYDEEEEEEEDKRCEAYNIAIDLWDVVIKCRYEFIENMSNADWKGKLEPLFRAVFIDGYIGDDAIAEMMHYTDSRYGDEWEEAKAANIDKFAKTPEKSIGTLLLFSAFNPTRNPFSRWGESLYNTEDRNHAQEIYKLLQELGYKPSDEEVKLMDGTHPVYKWEEVK